MSFSKAPSLRRDQARRIASARGAGRKCSPEKRPRRRKRDSHIKLLFGDRAAQLVSERVGAPVASLTVLKQTPANRRVDNQVFHVADDDTWWFWNDEATCSGDDVLAVTPNDSPSTGRFMRMPGMAMLAVTFYATTPSGTALVTVPSNTILQLHDFGVKVSRIFTGAAGAVVGLSSSNLVGHTGVFNLIGSCVQTTLNQAFSATAAGTGVSFQMAPVASGSAYAGRTAVRPWMKGGDTLRHDVGTAYGTGVGQWIIAAHILQNPGV